MAHCVRTPFAWQTRRVSKSPFRTLQRAKQAEAAFRRQRPIGFTATSSLKSMGRIPRSSGCFQLGSKYRGTARTRPAGRVKRSA